MNKILTAVAACSCLLILVVDPFGPDNSSDPDAANVTQRTEWTERTERMERTDSTERTDWTDWTERIDWIDWIGRIGLDRLNWFFITFIYLSKS